MLEKATAGFPIAGLVALSITLGGCSKLPIVSGHVSAEAAFAVLEGARSLFEEAKVQGKTDAEASELTAAWLRSQPQVRSAVVVDQDPALVEFTLRDGTPGMFLGGEPWSESPVNPDADTAAGVAQTAFAPKPTLCGPGSALILDPFPEFFVRTPRRLKSILEAIGYSVEHLEREQVDLYTLRRIFQYGVVFIATHGGLRESGDVALLSGERFDTVTWEAYAEWRTAGKIGYCGHSTQFLSRGTAWWFVTPKFFADLPRGSLRIFYAHACRSLVNDTMAKAVCDRGGATYAGWLTDLYIVLDGVVPERFFRALAGGSTVAEADAGDGSPAATYCGSGDTRLTGCPVAETKPATRITRGSATLNARINPGGLPSLVWFEWGASTRLGSVTPSQDVGSESENVAFFYDLVGLLPGTTYYFRAVASNSAGTTRGEILSFSTVPDGPPGDCAVVVRPGESIQAAIDKAPTGCWIYLEDGEWTENLVLVKSVTLVGTGSSTVCAAYPNAPVISVGNTGTPPPPQTFTIRGIRVTGGRGRYGVGIKASQLLQHLEVSDCLVENNEGGGIEVVLSERETANIVNTTIAGNGSLGIGVAGDGTVTIRGCTVSGRGVYGIVVAADAQVSIENCRLLDSCVGLDCRCYGLVLNWNAKVSIANTEVQGYTCGVSVNDVSTAQLTGCTVSSCQLFGIWASEQAHVGISGCTVTSCQSDGISVEDQASVEIRECTIASNRGNGVSLTNRAQAVITRNIVQNNGRYGIVAQGLSCGGYLEFSGTVSGEGNQGGGNGSGDCCPPDLCHLLTVKSPSP